MNAKPPFHLHFLQEEFARRQGKNPHFSLRAFAAKLDVDSGALSSILANKRPLSLKLGSHILKKLDCSPKVQERFLRSIAEAQSGRPLRRVDPRVRYLLRQVEQNLTTVLDESIYQTISEWYHAAILELSFREDFQASADFVAKILGISAPVAQVAINRLFELGLLTVEGEKVVKQAKHLDGNNQRVVSSALKQKQIQIRQKAIEAVENDPPKSRYMTTVTMCIDPDLLEEAKRRIDEFNDALCAFLESGARKKVYTMEIGLFCLEKEKNDKVKGVSHDLEISRS